jgi:hypothetical protein
MIRYQLDESTNARALAESCKREGLVEVWRWPKPLKGAKDPVALMHVLPSGRILLTTDRGIHIEHLTHIPDRHSGILIVASTSSAGTMRTSLLMHILAEFKDRFPTWHETSLDNSIVEISETTCEVWRVVRGALSRKVFLRFDDTAWQRRLSGVLQENTRVSELSGGD